MALGVALNVDVGLPAKGVTLRVGVGVPGGAVQALKADNKS